MSPDVFRLPVINKSEDSCDAGGLAFGADGAGFDGVEAAGLLSDLTGVSALGPGSLILDLENILSRSYVCHGIDGITANAHFVVQVWPSGPSRIAHITYSLTTRDPFTYIYANSV